MNQDQLFAQGEGDRWFERNQVALNSTARLADDPVLHLLAISKVVPVHVLEIGASNGYRLNALRAHYRSQVVAIEPSPLAIENGRQCYPEVSFLNGVASRIPIEIDGQFDLVIIHFVLHWVDRSTLLRSIAETDRMLADGGYLLVGDFYPATPERVVYHHLPDANVWTYKQDYAEVFLASGLYTRIATLTFDHTEHRVTADVVPENRVQVTLMRKSLSERYSPRELVS